ncbi:MAG TPA: YidB family protein [Casimicrobiaceae bacterium]|nr:YidB family protein [Casimicrobiaceae bacterium]
MGLLDGLLGGLMGGGTQGQSPLVQVALQLIEQNGGLPGIISKFQHGGMGEEVGSWVGTGQNLPMTGNQLQEILGSGSIGQIAQQLGLSHGDASSNLAQVLPQIIDKLTPTGQIPADHGDMLAEALSALSKRTA